MIHRIIKACLKGEMTGKAVKHFRKAAEYAADQSSVTERKAVELEREVEKLKKAEYISYHVGESFDGVISGVTGFGIYVQLENTVEGLIRMDELNDDYYDYDREKYALVGRRTGKMYRLGDEMSITVDYVDLGKREINFLPDQRR